MTDRVATQKHNLPLLATRETSAGRTYIVTGANVGLGLEAARHLVALGSSKVIMAVRNVSAGETAKADVEATTGVTGVAEVWALDLSSYDSVKAFAKKAITELDRIDAVIENAGVAMAQRVLAEGHLLPITVNVFSTFLLGVLLFPKLSETVKKFGGPAHLVVVSSGTAFDIKDEWLQIRDDPITKMEGEDFVVMKTYPGSKLLEILGVRQIASLLPVSETGVVVNAVCPGFCVTELSRNAPPAFRQSIKEKQQKHGRTAEDGSRTLLFAAVAGKESHGCLTDSCEIADHIVPDWVTDEEGQKSQKLVWDIITKELETAEPGCVTNILQ